MGAIRQIHEFVLQPVFSLTDDGPACAADADHWEMLIRPDGVAWEEVEAFVRKQERDETISAEDLAAIDWALQTLAGSPRENFRLAVNVSGVSLGEPEWLDACSALMKQFPRARKRLVVELTESSPVRDTELAFDFRMGLACQGVSFSLDDVGAAGGCHGGPIVEMLSPDYLKLDRSVVRQGWLDVNGRDLQSLIGVAHDMGARVVMEGAETHADLIRGQWWGVDLVQGWYLSKPRYLTDITEMVGDGQQA